MATDRVRIVLDDSVSEEALFPLINDNDWTIAQRFGQDGDQPTEYVYVTLDRANHIHYIEDHKIGITHLLMKGPRAHEIAEIMRDKLAYFTTKEIIERAREKNLSPEERRVALYQLALDKMEHGFETETFEIYKRAMGDKDPVVRGAAVLGSAYLGWPELAEPLRPLAETSEPDPSIRKDAALLVPRLEKLATK